MPRAGINQSFGRSHSIADSRSIDSILAYITCLQIYIHDARTNTHTHIYIYIYACMCMYNNPFPLILNAPLQIINTSGSFYS